MRHRYTWILLVVAWALVLAACGSSDGDDTTTTAGEGTTTTQASGGDGGGGEDTGGEDATDDTEPPQEGGKLVVVQGVDPRTLTPWTSVAAELSVTTQIFEKLISFNLNTGEYDPILAESYEWTDEVTLQIALRDGITFSNGARRPM